MKSNPGGHIPIDAIVGRDALCQTAWEVLDQQSLLMNAERRIGKTHVMRKMADEAPKGWVVIAHDLERVHTAADFAMVVYEDVERHLSRWKRTARRTRELLKALGGTEIGGFVKLPAGQATPWQRLVEGAVADLVEGQSDDTKLVFFWDEVPYMLQAIVRRESEETAMEILDLLRALRQRHPAFRMVLTGSIGLHHVVTGLKARGYANAPLNDVYELEVPPLTAQDARELADALLRGEGIATDDREAACASIAAAADDIPFYVHHIVRLLRLRGGRATPDRVTALVDEQLRDANDLWSLGHYRDRIRTYYAGRESLVRTCLDALALAAEPLPVDEVSRQLAARMPFDDRELLLRTLRLLERDHYVKRSADGYAWKFPLIARWWRIDRDL